MLAAEHTGQVTAVDPALRLLEVARARAASERRKVAFLPGEPHHCRPAMPAWMSSSRCSR